ncbi:MULTISPECIES: type II toxin-antitoxin system Phd/YefM family antitoxin [Pseudobutyrivibrio]|uniref:Antitoxin n=1 Tax=Pseudobutyrivibrio xylanivorans TaxID=185007 RepID=A0A1G5RUA4_PSEXY|nr:MULTISPECIES: type II toxin-antitoxin system Phd/YefM family antitoxin [Pseudobutyrivibrio]MDC7278514.1 type II toxin-antitoxin system Phd/YefM family antitoxin [Butyrivibrio fibrisolvens]SCZ77712.1 prevent-host-death family protein [Pseudobutyrivibrio xylanivorans]
MSVAFAEFTEQLVPISDFSQGKAGKIFADVANNNKEYIVLKNNQPTAVVISVEEYRRTQKRIKVLETYLEKLEDMFLLAKAEERKDSPTIPFEDVVKESGFTMDELEAIMDEVEIE